MLIGVKKIDGTTINLDVDDDQSVDSLRNELQEYNNIKIDEQAVVYDGLEIYDYSLKLSDYGIKDGSTLFLMMKIFVVTVDDTKITLLVLPSDTIANLKAKAVKELNKGIGNNKRYDDLPFTFDGKILDSNRNLTHYDIKSGSELQFQHTFNIYIINEETETFPFTISSTDVVAHVKAKIAKELKIPHNEQRLTYRNTELEDYLRISDYKVKKNGAINLIREFEICVRTPKGKLLRFPAKRQTPIQTLKENIKDLEDFPVAEQRLLLKGETFQDDKILGDYEIGDGKILELELMQTIKIQCSSGRFHVKTWPSETISHIKEEICRKLSTSFDGFRLLFENDNVRENTTEANSSITRSETLILEKEITLNVSCNDQKYSLTMWPSNTVKDVKYKIEESRSIKFEEQKLLLDGKHLRDESLLAKFVDHEILTLVLELRRELHSRFNFGELRSYQIWPSDNILDIKEIISRQENMASCNILLLQGKHAIKDDCPISKLGLSRTDPLLIIQQPRGFFVIVWNVEENTANCVQTNMSATVREMKTGVCQELGFKAEAILLFHHNNLLDDDSLLVDCGIVSSTTIFLVRRQMSGTVAYAWQKSPGSYEICAAAGAEDNDARIAFSKQHGMPANELELIFSSKPLHEERTLHEQGIEEGSVISTLSNIGKDVHVSVKADGHSEALLLCVSPSKTIFELKEDIEENLKISTRDQMLYFKGDMLYDSKKISEYQITDYSQLTLVCKVYFCVITLDSRQVELDVEHTLPVECLKMLLMEKFAIPTSRQRLLIDGGELLENDSLWQCVSMAYKPVIIAIAERKPMWIRIAWNDRKMHINVSPTDTILEVKNSIFKRSGVPTSRQILSYKEEGWNDDCTPLANKQLSENAEVVLMQSRSLDVIVNLAGRKRCEVSMDENATVAEIKTEIQRLAEVQADRREEDQPEAHEVPLKALLTLSWPTSSYLRSWPTCDFENHTQFTVEIMKLIISI